MIKKTLVQTLLISGLAFTAVQSLAEETKVPGSGPNPFSDCGIGAALFSETKWAAVTSNVIWDIGTTAVTSATASPETCNGKTVETALFINRTYDQLVEETSRGEGEHLTAMLDLMSCNSTQHSAAISSIRQSMAESVNSSEYMLENHTKKASSYYDMMSTAVNNHCTGVNA